MKNLFYVLTFAIVFNSCNVPSKDDVSYYEPIEPGIQSGGIKVIPIQTPKGVFKVWTKRIGNNPKIKVLLLNGGPGCTHEYFECFESFFFVFCFLPT